MKKIQPFYLSICLLMPGLVSADSATHLNSETSLECGARAEPLLSVADFDGDGKVRGSDVAELARQVNRGKYFALYDRNADSKLDALDIKAAAHDIGKHSTVLDQKVATLYQQTKVLQNASGVEQLLALGFAPITSSLAGHGVHWVNESSDFPVSGINVLEDNSAVKAIYFSIDAIPLFNDSAADSGFSALDYPSLPGAWMYERVQAFGDERPTYFDASLQYKWHNHAGLCITVQDLGTGPTFVLDQQTSFMECQVIPSQVQVPVGGQMVNVWFNIWMLHVWLFELNPAGTYAGTHPCVDPHAPSESDINGDRIVPPFFDMHM